MKKLREESSLMKKRISDLEQAIEKLENKNVPNGSSQRQKSVEQSGSVSRPFLVNFPDWDEFEFCTKRKGACGPSKNECLEYYSEK